MVDMYFFILLYIVSTGLGLTLAYTIDFIKLLNLTSDKKYDSETGQLIKYIVILNSFIPVFNTLFLFMFLISFHNVIREIVRKGKSE